MARYRIGKDGSKVSIEVADAGPTSTKLLDAFVECQAGTCSCPTDEYDKVASFEVERAGDLIKVRLETKPGETIDTDQVAACFDYTIAATAPKPGA